MELERERPGVEAGAGWARAGSPRSAEPACVESPGAGSVDRAETPSCGSERAFGSGLDMTGRSSGTISRLEGVRRCEGLCRRRGGESAAMVCQLLIVCVAHGDRESQGCHGEDKSVRR